MNIRRLAATDTALRPALRDLLIDAVHGGASIGFLAPLSAQSADRYWDGVFAELGEGLLLWVAESDQTVVGAVQLAPCGKANGQHRAEIQKLFVRTDWRGKGISSQLMSTAESHASAIGRRTLVLDTEAGSVAEQIYRHLGWQKAGEIPDYAASPDGRLHPTAYYYKRLSA